MKPLMTIHADRNRILTDRAHDVFSSRKVLRHMLLNVVHPMNENCDSCGEYFKVLKNHLPLHAPEIRECDICGTSYKNVSS